MSNNVRWSVKVGKAHSSPIVVGALVLVTSEPNLLICLNCSNGQELWRIEAKPENLPDEPSRKTAAEYVPPKNGSGMAAATPLTDGQNVYVVFANGIVRAVDLKGQSKWTAFINTEQSTSYGRSSSPILVAGKLIVHMTHLYAFDPATGKPLWVNTEAKSTYGTPAGMRLGDTEFIITSAGDVVRADNGKGVLSGLGQSQYATPLVVGDVIYFADRSLKTVRLAANLTAKDLWECEMPGDIFGTPLLHEGILFLTTGKGELFAFDTQGKEPQKPIIEARLLFAEEEGAVPITYSSLTFGGKYLFLPSNKGTTVVLTPSREAKLVSTNLLPSGSGSSPVFAGKAMFLRDGEKLYCIGE